MNPMEKTETLTKAFRDSHDLLAERVADLEDQIEALKRRRLPGIKTAVRAAADRRSQLAAHIEAHPELFEKPRTVTIAGIRVGIMKSKGKIEWDDPDQVCRLIRRHYPDQAETLIKITEAPVRKALGQLGAAELKKIGCRIEDTGDEILIKPVDSEVDKLVTALLKEAEEWEEAA